MAVITRDELISRVSAIIGDRQDDAALGVLEDITDTMNVFSEAIDWRDRYEENDREWRRKYRERFENGPVTEEGNKTVLTNEEIEAPEKDKTISELFKEGN